MKIKYARLHEAIQMPQLGAVGPAMSSAFSPVDKQYEMVLKEPFVITKTKVAGKDYEFYIPLTAFALLQPEPETKTKK